jgi:signal transduction histidine kinase/CheY-like chemotaxis protein
VQPAERAADDLPLPLRNFAATRRVLLVVLAVSIVFPLACLAGYGYFDYQRRIADAGNQIDRLARVAEEQAVKVFDLNYQVSARLLDLLDDADDAAIRARQAPLHARLRALAGRYSQIAAIAIYGTDGALLATSRVYPAPARSIAQRSDFAAARERRPQPYFSQPAAGPLAASAAPDTSVFDTSIGRSAGDGRFLGVVQIVLRSGYFSRFYSELTNHDTSLSLGLLREDGHPLVRYPAWPPHAASAAHTPLVDALHERELFGEVRMKSSVDGVERLLAFRRVGDYPVYVVSGCATGAIAAQWLRHFALLSAIALVPCASVWLLVFFSLRRLAAERLAWERWQGEVAMRLSAEASSRQLQRMGALSNLVANVAHDFNNMLMVVSSNMALARKKHCNGVDAEVSAVERAIAGAEALTRRLLSVARKQPLRQAPLDLAQWLPETATLIRAALGDNVQFALHVATGLWPVLVDPTELAFALVNLAANARTAMPRGGRFMIRCQNVRLVSSDTLLPDGEYVLIACTDDGEGMTGTVMQRAFEPLFTTRPHGAGTGLGLTQVLAMCEQAGGTAKLDSVPGSGTTARLYLPHRRAEPAPGTVPQTPASADVPGAVLLVEDNEDVAAGIAAVLQTFGCAVRHEITADRALDVLSTGERFSLVLSDIQMPGRLNGVDLAERVRSAWPAQRIALMTGYADELERARHIGIEVLAKPFDIDALHALLQCA